MLTTYLGVGLIINKEYLTFCWMVFLLFAGRVWKFVPRKFIRPPKEFLIYGNEVRQTVMDNFVSVEKKVVK